MIVCEYVRSAWSTNSLLPSVFLFYSRLSTTSLELSTHSSYTSKLKLVHKIMRFATKVATPLALAGLVAAAPASNKASLVARENNSTAPAAPAPAPAKYDDATILNYALT